VKPWILRHSPSALTCSKNHLYARYILAKLGLRRGSARVSVKLPSAEATALIIEHFTARIETTGIGRRALQVMHARGIIAALPPDIASIVMAPRRCGGTG
jgi:hypothetical protein